MAKLYGLIFDVDGVIADTEAVNAAASIKVFADLFGAEQVRREDFEAGLGRGAQEYVRAAGRVHGLELTDEQVAVATAARQDEFLRILAAEPLCAFGGVLELMTAAMARDDVRLAIATSSTRVKSEAVLKSAKVPYDQMEYISGSEVTNKKPHPELFLTAAKRIDVPPSECVVIEDAPNGVAAAKSAGCKCIAVTNSTTADKLAQADLVIDSVAEVSIERAIGIIERKS